MSLLKSTLNTLQLIGNSGKDSGGGYVASLDSTGVKIHGQSEWNRKKHSQKDQRQWVKVHLIIDNDTMQILGVEATADDVHDSEVFDQLIDVLPNKINKVTGSLKKHKTTPPIEQNDSDKQQIKALINKVV